MLGIEERKLKIDVRDIDKMTKERLNFQLHGEFLDDGVDDEEA